MVVDDSDTDKPRQVIEAWRRASHSVRVEYIEPRPIMETYIFALSLCRGKYIAFCDDDDYWTNEGKLALQVATMEKNPQIGAVATDHDAGGPWLPDPITYNDLLKGCPLTACTVLFRNIWQIPGKELDLSPFFAQDWPLWIHISRHFEIGWLSYRTAHYTTSAESYSHSRSRRKRARHLVESWKIRWHFISRYGCRVDTALYLIYKLARDCYSLALKRW